MAVRVKAEAKTTIMLVDDHAILRDGLAHLLQENERYEVVGHASNGFDAIEFAGSFEPQVILMDIGLPGLNGIDTTHKILSRFPAIKVIGLSMQSDAQFVVAMLKVGARGYVLKDSAYGELLSALNAVLKGKIYISPTIAGDVVIDFMNGTMGDNSPLGRLSAREREVLQSMAEGTSTVEIGNLLHISPKTVETHRKHLMEKLNLHTVAELTKFAVRSGLTSLDN
ncbi:MAG: two-component system response regulator NreC [Gammaproteobacteria bacterium]|jgi:two-component system response regulator NreC